MKKLRTSSVRTLLSVILLLIIMFFPSLQFFKSLKNENGNHHSRNKRTSTCTFKCTNEDPVKPVCGSDGITYPNRCELQKVAKCLGKNVIFQQDGECSSGNK